MLYNIHIRSTYGFHNWIAAVEERDLRKLVGAYHKGEETVFINGESHGIKDPFSLKIYTINRPIGSTPEECRKYLTKILLSEHAGMLNASFFEEFGENVSGKFLKGEWGYLKNRQPRSEGISTTEGVVRGEMEEVNLVAAKQVMAKKFIREIKQQESKQGFIIIPSEASPVFPRKNGVIRAKLKGISGEQELTYSAVHRKVWGLTEWYRANGLSEGSVVEIIKTDDHYRFIPALAHKAKQKPSAGKTVVKVAKSNVIRSISKRETQVPAKGKIFIGHGRSKLYASLELHLRQDHGLDVVNFESESRVSRSIIDELKRMLEEATFAIIILTEEDETVSGGAKRARQNVIHEVGLFQGKLGFEKVVLLRQGNVEEFTNVAGLQYIHFTGDHIDQTYYQLQRVLMREGII